MNELFGSTVTVVGAGHYDYVYNRIDGGKYTQAG